MRDTARTFVLVGLVVAMLLAMHLLPSITIGGMELRHVNILSDVCPEPQQPPSAMAKAPVPPTPPPPAAQPQADSTSAPTVATPSAVGAAIADYSAGQPGGMAHFREALAQAGTLGRPVRVAYYGDSFVEGDILTADLREMLQKQYGGKGVGWIDCHSNVAQFRPTIKQRAEGIVSHDVMSKPFNRSRQSFCQRYFVASGEARLEASATNYRQHLSPWTSSRLYLRTSEPLTVVATTNHSLSDTTSVMPAGGVQAIAAPSAATTNVTFSISGASADSTTLFGMALESASGVIVDNLSMRGSSGHRLAEVPPSTLSDFARLRPYDLIVLHFGLNVVSDKSANNNFSAYASHMERVVRHMRQAYPEASILIVSVSDRDQRTDQGIATLDGIEPLVAYQQMVAAKCQVAFFNMFEAMGGAGSMATLVDKGWANKDYTHLSFAGGRHLAKLLYDALCGQ